LDDEGLKRPPSTLKFAKKEADNLDLGVLSDLPDLSAMFEEDQEMTKTELDNSAMEKLSRMMEQINSLNLHTSDLSDFRTVFNRMRGLDG
jgi:hypothetical protein